MRSMYQYVVLIVSYKVSEMLQELFFFILLLVMYVLCFGCTINTTGLMLMLRLLWLDSLWRFCAWM